jgi:hypothetical protein
MMAVLLEPQRNSLRWPNKQQAASGRVAVQLKRLDDFVHVLFFDEPFVGGQEVAGEVAEMIFKVAFVLKEVRKVS